jgi:hypothetical protein
MTLIARNSGGNNLVGRIQANRPWYPTNRVRPVRVEVWWRYAGEVAAAARYLGTYSPGQEISFPFNPVVDRDLIFSTVTISPNGIRSVRELADAHEVLLTYTRAGAQLEQPIDQQANKRQHAPGMQTVATGVRYPNNNQKRSR